MVTAVWRSLSTLIRNPPTTASAGPRAPVSAAQSMSASLQKRRSERLPRHARFVPILLQKSLMVLANSDSVALIRFAAESGDDGAAQSRPRSAVLLVLS